MRIFGLTGGIGSGKSAAAAMFEEAGIPVINADQAGRELLKTCAEINAQVVEMFGASVLRDGLICHERLAERIFGNSEARRALNAILHPAILRAVAGQCEALRAQGRRVAIVEAALMGEDGNKDSRFDGIILVLADRATRMRRLVHDRGMSAEDVERRMKAQSDPESKRGLSDYIIDNNGDREALRRQAHDIAAALLQPSE